MPEDKTHLSEAELTAAIKALDAWTRDGIYLRKDFRFANYREINAFLPYMTATIVRLNHHPDFEFVGGEKRVSFSTTTHSEGKLTRADITLAAALDAWRTATPG